MCINDQPSAWYQEAHRDATRHKETTMSSAAKAIGSIFSAPKIKAPATQAMPAMGTFQQKLAARQTQRKDQKKRKGRDSTMKTAGSNYSGANLGGTA
jgi:hypothetical protein